MIEMDFLPRTVMPKVNVTINGVTASIRLDELLDVAKVFSIFGLSFTVSPLDD